MSSANISQNSSGPVVSVDVAIIGAGIAGASLGAMLAPHKSVVLLEKEPQPGYHATGRSAAIFTEVYGNAVIRALTSASRNFYQEPPHGFADQPLWHDIDTYMIGTSKQRSCVDALYDDVKGNSSRVSKVSGHHYESLIQIARPGMVASAVLDAGSKVLDVAAIHQVFLKMFENLGGKLLTDAGVAGISRENGLWMLSTAKGQVACNTVVNAAGAWAGEIAACAGALPISLTPLRRTVCVVKVPEGVSTDNWPMSVDVEEQFYFKPESGRLLCSSADETPSQPCDAQPEDIDVAIAVDRIQNILDLPVHRIEAKWAGLRTFAADKTPVVGFDPQAPGFFWLAGQGGYGIQTAPAMAEVAAALLLDKPLPVSVTSRGVSAATLAPDRHGLHELQL